MKQNNYYKTIAFVGHRQVVTNVELESRCYNELEKLILSNNVGVFLFGSKSSFDDLCLKMVTKLKSKYKFIRRVYVRAEYEFITEDYRNYLLQFYDDTVFPDCVRGSGKASYIKRNEYIIDLCDIAFFYYNKNYKISQSRSGTTIAYNYAIAKCKKILNIFDN